MSPGRVGSGQPTARRGAAAQPPPHPAPTSTLTLCLPRRCHPPRIWRAKTEQWTQGDPRSKLGSDEEGARGTGRGSSPGSQSPTQPRPPPPRHSGGGAGPSLQTAHVSQNSGPRADARSLVGGMAVTDHLRQDPLLIPIHGLYPGGHLVSGLGHVVPRGWNGPTEGWGPRGWGKALVPALPSGQLPTPLRRPRPALTCHQASRSTGAGSWPTAAAGSSAPPGAWSSEGAPSRCTGPRSWPLWEGSAPLRHEGQRSHRRPPAARLRGAVSRAWPGGRLPSDRPGPSVLLSQTRERSEQRMPSGGRNYREKGFWGAGTAICSVSEHFRAVCVLTCTFLARVRVVVRQQTKKNCQAQTDS